MESPETGLLRALCFHTVWGYAPTRAELLSSWDGGLQPSPQPGLQPPRFSDENRPPLSGGYTSLLDRGLILERRGRCVFAGHEDLIAEHERREGWFPRKIRVAQLAVRWFCRIGGVRFVAVCNTTALGHGRNDGDIDFIIIGRAGRLWQIRAWAAVWFWFMRRRPSESYGQQDAVCLSFFVDDEHLDLAPLMLGEDDVYFRHWFLSLLPLYDDGVGRELWRQNASIRKCHPCARPWTINPYIGTDPVRLRIPVLAFLEKPARFIQTKAFGPAIREAMNRDTRVVVRDGVLKFHVEDGREAYRDRYRELCKDYGIEP